MKCKVCSEFEHNIKGRKNFSDKWIVGADSVRISNVRDHAKNDQHGHAMALLRKKKAMLGGGAGPSSYAHFVAVENLPFTKYSKICKLESHHGIQIGNVYTNDNAGKEMVHFIAESRREQLQSEIKKAKFLSLLLDGSSNIDNEMILAVWCDINGEDEKVHTRMDTIVQPQFCTAEGLFKVLESALQRLDIDAITKEKCSKLIGLGTDGASANVAASGLKGLVEGRLSWVFWMWCMAHRLELAIKDALKKTAFDLIDELLLRLYYLYEKSPKKCCELEDVVSDLKGWLTFDDNGVRPVRASGSRWIAHKFQAMKRVLSKYCAYTNHIAALSTDRSVTSTDRAKLKGYYNKWKHAKYLFGCALFADLLNPCAVLSKSLQKDDVDILGALTGIIKTLKETEKLASKPLEEWPTYAATLNKCSPDGDDGAISYQCQSLKGYKETLRMYSTKYTEYCSRVTEYIKSRLSWSDLEMMRDIIFVLSSHGWEKAVEEKNNLESIERLVERFIIPLQGAGVLTGVIKEEFQNMIEYAVEYIAVSSLDYKSVWWRLFHAPNASEWQNALTLATLLFSLPASNGKL